MNRTRRLAFVVPLVLLWIAVPARAAGGYGMTWVKSGHDSGNGTDQVGCAGCDPYGGDTSCKEYRPVLCLIQDGSPVPPGFTPDFYNGWQQGHIGITFPVQGLLLTSLAVGDLLCQYHFGIKWRMAEFHHSGSYGTGGWNWKAYGNINDDFRYWVHINDQPGNCWDP